MDPLTLGVLGSAGASLYGAISGGNAQNKAIKQQQDRYNQLSGMVQGQMQTGTNPYADMITKFAQGLGSSPASTYSATNAQAPGEVDINKILTGSGYNTGQDSMLQLMRRQLTPTQDPSLQAGIARQASGNTAFDNTDLFKALAPMDQFGIQQQVDALHGQARSLGQLAGGPMQNAEALLRSQMASSIGARNAGIQQQSYESAQQRAMQGLGLQAGQEQAGNQFALGAYGAQTGANQGFLQAALQAAGLGAQAGMQGQQLGAQTGMFNAGNQNQAGQFNAGQQNSMAQFLQQLRLQGLGQAGALQGQQQGQNAQLLQILGGMGQPGVPQSPVPGAIGDASQMLMLYPFLRQMMPGGGGGAPPWLQSINQMPFGYLQGLGGGLAI